MSWLLFLDESGHDHKVMPYEVRGGVALHDSKIWPFVQAMQRLEETAFGSRLFLFRKELKGSKLLDKDRFKWAKQLPRMDDAARQKHTRRFLTNGLEKKPPKRADFTAYGQACIEMARGVFQLLHDFEAVIFAACIPRNVQKPISFKADEYLRKDHVFLFERFFYHLEREKEYGILVFDETEKTADRGFVKRLEDYFTKTTIGRYRTSWIVPVPFFVASDMAYPIQVADLCIYCINWGFRSVNGMNATVRQEIADEFGPWLNKMQFTGDGYRQGDVFHTYGIVFVPDPYTSR